MNQNRIYLLSQSVSLLMKAYLVVSIITLGTMMFSTGFSFDTSLPDAYMPLLSSGRGLASDNTSALQTIEYIDQSIVMILAILSLFSYYLVSRIFGKIASGESPFSIIQIKRLKIVSYLFLANFFIYTFLPNILYFLFVEGDYRNMTVDLGRLLIALIIFTIAEVCAYGKTTETQINE